jgi:hypothetical protein
MTNNLDHQQNATHVMIADPVPTLTHATERDVDLLLVEELLSSGHFVRWVASHVWPDAKPVSWKTLHSHRPIQNRREVDITVQIDETGGRKSALLIENKLVESPQFGQAESYRVACQRLVIEKQVDSAACLLVCPDGYCDEWPLFAQAFDATIIYEDIGRMFFSRAQSESAEISRRLRHRASIMEQAVERRRRGYVAVEHPAVGTFNQAYLALLRQIAPDIKPGPVLLKTARRPSESVSMIFDHVDMLPSTLQPRRYSHELGNGEDHRTHCVQVTWGGWGARWPDLKPNIIADLDGTPYKVRVKSPTPKRPNPGLVVYAPTPAVDNKGGPEKFLAQRSAITAGIEAADALRRFVIDRAEMIEGWEKIVNSRSAIRQ